MPDAAAAPPNPLDQHLGRKKGQEFLDGAREFERSWLYTCRERGIWRLWWLIYCNVHGIDVNTGAYNSNAELQFAGSQDQYAKFRVQLARRYINQRKMMAQDQRLSFTGVATQSDVASLAQVNIATRGIEYLLTESKLEQEASEALESLCYYGAGALLEGWDYRAGDKVLAKEPERDMNGEPMMMPAADAEGNPIMRPNPQTGAPEPEMQPVMKDVEKPSGAPRYEKLYPWQTAVDPYKEKNHTAVVTKTPVNKWELAAKYPEKAKDIIALGIDDEMGDDALFAWGGSRAVSSDIVVLRQYFERDSEAVPGGRWAGYIQNVGLWGVDDIQPCPVEKGLPVKFMIGARYHGTAYGYPESGDLLALQTVVNEMISACVTNAIKRGNANAYKREDVQIDPMAWSLGGGLHDLPAGAPPPTWDEPPKMDTLSQYVIEFVTEQARLMLGSNSVTEGNPEANISSGSFAVLLVNVAQKYANQAQEAHDNAATEAANDGLDLAKKNAQNGFWAEIAGLDDSPYVMITQQALKSLRRVKLIRQSPVLSTFVGREVMYDKLIALPKRDRHDASEFLLHGRLEAFAERDQASRLRIRKENEMLLKGVLPVVAIWDDHAIEGPLHRMEYDKLRTMDPPKDPVDYANWQNICQLFDTHLQGHAMALATAPPPMAIVAGWAPLQATAPGGGPGDQQPQEQGGPGGQKRPGAGSQPGPSGGGSAPQAPKPPSPPKAPKGAGGLGSTV